MPNPYPPRLTVPIKIVTTPETAAGVRGIAEANNISINEAVNVALSDFIARPAPLAPPLPEYLDELIEQEREYGEEQQRKKDIRSERRNALRRKPRPEPEKSEPEPEYLTGDEARAALRFAGYLTE